MDKVEKYFQEHQEEFEFLQAGAENWEKISGRLATVPTRTIPPLWRRYWMAASVMLLITAGSIFYFNNNNLQSEVVVGMETGEYFPDILLRDPDGKPVSLSSLKGKVVLVEFWASYSKICTDQHCFYFKPLYEEYRDKGFEIFAVSVDSSAVEWIGAIQQDQLDWVQVSDLEGSHSPMIREFNLDQLPMTFLLNEDGKVLAKDIDAENLQDQLNQLLAYN